MSTYKFKTTNIRGKKYVEVNERIKFFRQEEQYKNWGITTEFPMLTPDECLCRATITDKDGMVIAVGHAHENRAASNINKTSYVENCETSAVGRALAMLGIGIDTSIASANEVETAIAQQGESHSETSAPKQEVVTEVVENIMDKAVDYVKSSTDKRKAYDSIVKKYGDQMTKNQLAGLKKFVR
jgi:hypothetical protein|tara:strand:+ start:403 stop:954 length:552 start_codon:yes stop_codon:yes gene_type:complete